MDSEEIKKHPWFAGINWEDVQNRKLKPPKPSIKKMVVPGLLSTTFEIHSTEKKTDKIDGWSFASTEKKSIIDSHLS